MGGFCCIVARKFGCGLLFDLVASVGGRVPGVFLLFALGSAVLEPVLDFALQFVGGGAFVIFDLREVGSSDPEDPGEFGLCESLSLSCTAQALAKAGGWVVG